MLAAAMPSGTWEAEARGLQVRGHTWLHHEILYPKKESGEPGDPKVKGDSAESVEF